jgi:hypothetical protein
MRDLLKTIVGLGFLVIFVLAVISFFGQHNGAEVPNTTSSAPTVVPGVAEPTYQESNEILSPYALSKNPFKWKNHSGILDTVDVPILMGVNGAVVTSVRYPGGGLKFEKMIDEHTATYSVLVAEGSVMHEGEIAVILPDSDPPDSTRLWRVFVEGPMEGENAFGASIRDVCVRFEGYYIPRPAPAQTNQGPASGAGGGEGQVGDNAQSSTLHGNYNEEPVAVPPARATSAESPGAPALNGVEEEVNSAVENWARANESNDPTVLAKCYAEHVDRYFLRLNVTNTFVRDYAEEWLKSHDARVTLFRVKKLTFKDEAPMAVKVDLVEEVVTTDSKGSAERLTHSQLYLKKVDEQWKITSERDFK